MDLLLGKPLTRRIMLEILGLASGVNAPSAIPQSSPSPIDNADAVWEMTQAAGSGSNGRKFETHGDVQIGIGLTGEEKAESSKRGSRGFAALFNGGWLEDAGPDWGVGGSALTFALRLKDPSGEWSTPLFGKSGGQTRESFYLHASDLNDSTGMALVAEIGSDEVAGMHRVRTSAFPLARDLWHDIVVRFDGKTLELFVDGALRDNEAAIGTVRENRSRRCLIGAGIPNEDGHPRADFQGLVNYAAVWKRALSDSEVAQISGVAALSDKRPAYYHERYRPQFHFSAQKHWINDPNGLVYYKGVYHMFFQHMPPGRTGAYKDWGHAISTDLVHWKQVRTPITPHKTWGGCWSGSAIVDWHNAAGFESGKEKTIVAILTNGGEPEIGPPCTQCIAYSNDAGVTFTYFDGNPVLPHIVASNRDPKVIWHAPMKKWVMALYLDGNEYALFGSADLKNWQRLSSVPFPGTSECPDLFELAVDGDPSRKKWVFWGASGNHMIGTFDGATFHPESGVLTGDYGDSFYAAQSWSDIDPADGRRIQIGWLRRGDYPGMPFTQQMNFPTELTLRTTPEGIRLYRTPVRELSKLRMPGHKWSNVDLNPGMDLFNGIEGDLLEIKATVEVGKGNSSGFSLSVRGASIDFDAAQKTISLFAHSAPLAPENGRVSLTVLADRTSLEVFCNGGRVVLSSCFLPADNDRKLKFHARGGPAGILAAEVNPLRSIWM
ncbi:MAG: GH32 C-terminal domain-containing protein [Acidobacteriota bacterium]|nr:GH32 C-terminal domain-containing protein [Acidobacteriota bacterium]